ncbi:hypothetical protein FH972_022841 [Carpinus fangiana]|uniref:Uncharacterized protein n=1 Tax=Carpinus fangiana TaxID=176857 RepID=A0A5N6KTQ9_9ROSI|nr:hypothetical protein FH972_022841 [Carpinus fangiana]
MPRTKASPIKREASNGWVDHKQEALRERSIELTQRQSNGNGHSTPAAVKEAKGQQHTSPATAFDLVVCVLGIYGSLWVSSLWTHTA